MPNPVLWKVNSNLFKIWPLLKFLYLDIAFSTELGNEERKIIHRGAQESFYVAYRTISQYYLSFLAK